MDILKDILIAFLWNLSVELIMILKDILEDVLEDILWTYQQDLSAELILNSRISWISQDKSGYPDLSGACKIPDTDQTLWLLQPASLQVH